MTLTKSLAKAVEIIAHDNGAINRFETLEDRIAAAEKYLYDPANGVSLEGIDQAGRFLSCLDDDEMNEICIGEYRLPDVIRNGGELSKVELDLFDRFEKNVNIVLDAIFDSLSIDGS